MFTGIVEGVGTITRVRERADTREFEIEAPGIGGELEPGASISVDGACQTVVARSGERFTVETIGTTLSRTIAGGYRVGSRVNLERALRVGDRLDGHFVQGHVDGVGRLLGTRKEGDFWLMDFEVPGVVWAVTILHGSIAINGVSLTVNALPGERRCQVGIIPYTWEHTNLGELRPGDPVNMEGDLLGKYVGKILSTRPDTGGPSLADLEGMGY